VLDDQLPFWVNSGFQHWETAADDLHIFALQALQQPRRAEYLPPDWAVIKSRNGSRTYLGPFGQRLRFAVQLPIRSGQYSSTN
jgi:hypothetical protein